MEESFKAEMRVGLRIGMDSQAQEQILTQRHRGAEAQRSKENRESLIGVVKFSVLSVVKKIKKISAPPRICASALKLLSLCIFLCLFRPLTIYADEKFLIEPGFAWPELSAKQNSTEISFLWWNINEGIANRYLEKKQGSPPLDQNLLALIASPHAPDVLAFGEYNQNLLKKETLTKLKETYSYSLSEYIPYNAKGNAKGIMVFSKLPLALKVEREMDYYPLSWNKKEGGGEKIAAYHTEWENDGTGAAPYYKRCYLYFEVEKNGHTVAFVPTHIMEPMARVLRDKNVSRWKKMLAKYEFVYGDSNPFYYQLEWLRSYLERDFGLNLDRQPLVMMGDFNMLRKYLWTTQAYKMISKGLLDPFEEEKDSWPVPSARKHPIVKGMYQVDHAFYNRLVEVKNAEVLPLMGSDHFPLYLEARLKNVESRG